MRRCRHRARRSCWVTCTDEARDRRAHIRSLAHSQIVGVVVVPLVRQSTAWTWFRLLMCAAVWATDPVGRPAERITTRHPPVAGTRRPASAVGDHRRTAVGFLEPDRISGGEHVAVMVHRLPGVATPSTPVSQAVATARSGARAHRVAQGVGLACRRALRAAAAAGRRFPRTPAGSPGGNTVGSWLFTRVALLESMSIHRHVPASMTTRLSSSRTAR
jgi:hypothetical protein